MGERCRLAYQVSEWDCTGLEPEKKTFYGLNVLFFSLSLSLSLFISDLMGVTGSMFPSFALVML